jgi:hypothetical protein
MISECQEVCSLPITYRRICIANKFSYRKQSDTASVTDTLYPTVQYNLVKRMLKIARLRRQSAAAVVKKSSNEGVFFTCK